MQITPLLQLWDHNIRYQSQSQAWKLTYEVSNWRVDRMGADTSVIKKKQEWNPMADEGEWIEKHRNVKGEWEKTMDTNAVGNPGYQRKSK